MSTVLELVQTYESNPSVSNRELHVRALKISETYRRCEAELLDVLTVLDETAAIENSIAQVSISTVSND